MQRPGKTNVGFPGHPTTPAAWLDQDRVCGSHRRCRADEHRATVRFVLFHPVVECALDAEEAQGDAPAGLGADGARCQLLNPHDGRVPGGQIVEVAEKTKCGGWRGRCLNDFLEAHGKRIPETQAEARSRPHLDLLCEDLGGAPHRRDAVLCARKNLRAIIVGQCALTAVLAFLLPTASFGQSCIVPAPAGLTGWWKGDGTPADIIGGRDGSLKNGTGFTSGMVGQSFALDGIDDWIDVPNDPALNVGTGDWAISMWVYLNSSVAQQVLVEKLVAPGTGWSILNTSPTHALPAGSWVHVGAGRQAGTFVIIVNGAMDHVSTYPADLSSTASLKFGHRGSPSDTPGSNDASGLFLNGRIDEIMLFVGTAPSLDDMVAIYAAGPAGVCAPTPVCGNGRWEAGEECDDGNLLNDDGCDNNCNAHVCGDGVVDTGEECDDGNTDNTDACPATCRAAFCGDAFVQAGVEECDDGTNADWSSCVPGCKRNVCGEGFWDRTGPEGCDDGNLIDGDGCDSDCTKGCGNGRLTADEQCDDGNRDNGDGCDYNCTLTGCGNGMRTQGEECDDGNSVETDGCLSTCLRTPGQLAPSFDTDGIAVGGYTEEENLRRCPLAVLGDGRIVVAHTTWNFNPAPGEGSKRFGLTRFHADGSVDASFGDNGSVETMVGDDSALVRALVVQSDGKLVVAGLARETTGDHIALARYTSDGVLDTTFDQDGIVVTTAGTEASSVAIDPNTGAIVVAGSAPGDTRLVARYHPNGSLDTSFGPGGIVIDNRAPGATSMAVRPDGTIVTVGLADFLATAWAGNLMLTAERRVVHAGRCRRQDPEERRKDQWCGYRQMHSPAAVRVHRCHGGQRCRQERPTCTAQRSVRVGRRRRGCYRQVCCHLPDLGAQGLAKTLRQEVEDLLRLLEERNEGQEERAHGIRGRRFPLLRRGHRGPRRQDREDRRQTRQDDLRQVRSRGCRAASGRVQLRTLAGGMDRLPEQPRRLSPLHDAQRHDRSCRALRRLRRRVRQRKLSMRPTAPGAYHSRLRTGRGATALAPVLPQELPEHPPDLVGIA